MHNLTERELEVVRLIDDGRTFKEIGTALGISPRTAKAFSDQIRWKLGVARKRDIPAVLKKLGVIE